MNKGRRMPRPSTTNLVWGLIAAISCSALALWLFVLFGAEPISPAFDLHWGFLAAGFFAVQAWVVLMHFRSEASSFSFFEIPLILGLLFGSPTWSVPAVVAGSTLALHFVKKLPPVKVAFNVANFTLHFVVAWVVLDTLVGSSDPLEPAGWLAILLAVAISGSLELVNIWLVVSIVEGGLRFDRFGGMIIFALLVSGANYVQALVMALLLTVEPASVVLLIASTVVLYLAYRSYLSERDQRERVEFLYRSTRSLIDNDDEGPPAGPLLAEAATMFRAGIVELHTAATGSAVDQPGAGTILTWRNGAVEQRDMTAAERAHLDELTKFATPAVICDPINPVAAQLLSERGFADAMLGALHSGEGRTGLLLVADRLGDVSTFVPDDLQLFSTLVQHAALALENDELELAIGQLRSLERELAHQASHDGLTGLANRALLGRRLNELLQTDDPSLTLLYLDLDDFKEVNDTLGHGAGDAVLIEAAKRLSACVRPTDVAARLGGDEFAVLLVDSVRPDLVAERALDSLNRPYVVDDSNTVNVGASVGRAVWSPGQTAADLIAHADVAMYAAKQLGKGSIQVFEDAMHAEASARQQLRSQLRTAVADEQFSVLYQPIIDLRTGRVVAAEALVRWVSPEGLLLPQGFIDEAEQSGLIVPIDSFVFARVLDDLESLSFVGHSDIWLASNLSMRTLQEPDLVDRVQRQISNAGADSNRIVLEVTETALMHDPDFATSQLNRLRDGGVRVALDDFGTGYSSLSYLRRFPLDILKIAQPFVNDLEQGDSTFVRAMTDLGHTLGLDVLAEGIEQVGSLHSLDQLGVDLGQGYYFARPLPLDGFKAALDSQKKAAVGAPTPPAKWI